MVPLGISSAIRRKAKLSTDQLQESCPQQSKVQPYISGEHTSCLLVGWSVTLGSQLKACGGEAQGVASCPGTLLQLLASGGFGQTMVELQGRDRPIQIVHTPTQQPLLPSYKVHRHLVPTPLSQHTITQPQRRTPTMYPNTHPVIFIPLTEICPWLGITWKCVVLPTGVQVTLSMACPCEKEDTPTGLKS